jgi:UDP-galactopyranose mutase
MISDENNMKYYDLIILGAGPSGLALAHVSTSIYRNILIIDREQEIGGIHRVIRDYYGVYTEYGPRIYMTAFYIF